MCVNMVAADATRVSPSQVGLAVGDIQSIYDEAKLKKLSLQVRDVNPLLRYSLLYLAYSYRLS